MPHRRARRSCGAVRSLSSSSHRVQLLQESPLSEVPVHSARQVAGGKVGRASAGSVLPRRFHLAAGTVRTGASESALDLWHAPPRRVRNTADHRLGPASSGGAHWLPGRTAYLESKNAPSSAPALRGSLGRIVIRSF